MSAIGYEIHVLKKQEWALLKTFSADDKATAQNFFASLDRAMGYEGKKLIEEAVKDNGLLFSSTVSFQIFDPGPETKARPSSAAETIIARDDEDNDTNRDSPPDPPASPLNEDDDGAPSPNLMNKLLSFFQVHAEHLRNLKYNFFRRKKRTNFARFGIAARTKQYNQSAAGRSNAYTKRYADEADLSTNELVQFESAEVLGSAFFMFIRRNLLTDTLAQDSRFHIGICCFAVGALVRIETELKLNSRRGEALLNDALKVFLLQEQDIQLVIDQMALFLAQDASVRFIKAGARCFNSFEVGDLQDVTDIFRETFSTRKIRRAALGQGEQARIFIVQIADPAQLREEFGTNGVQRVIDHLWQSITALNKLHGGRTVKAMGDGILCSVESGGAMAAILVDLLHRDRNPAKPTEVPPYQICVGGHFGGSIVKRGDVFGLAVQYAAALAEIAEPGGGCVAAELATVVTTAGGRISRRDNVRLSNKGQTISILHIS